MIGNRADPHALPKVCGEHASIPHRLGEEGSV